MQARWLAAAAALLLGVSLCSALSCTPCEKTTCAETACPGRTVRDVCGCCLVCARELGQPCGGYFDSLGLCDDGLVCQTSPQHGQAVDIGAEGICTKNTTDSPAGPCIKHVCQLMLGKCMCTDLSECHPPVAEGDPTTFHTRPECEKAAALSQVAPTSSTKAPVVSCPDVTCEEGATSCPADSVRKTSAPTQPACCPPVGVCLCDLESCPRTPSCPEGQEASLLTAGDQQPGSCCDVWECKPAASPSPNCTQDGHTYAAGDTWLSGDCRRCHCKVTGLVFCRAEQCPSVVNCSGEVVQTPGHCCPQCVDGCMSPSGVHHNSSEKWLEDDCTTCSCIAGQLRCHSEMCHIACRNPRHVPGRCCPVCDECDVMCQHGYRTARDGSQLCQCLTAEEAEAPTVQCRSMATCRLSCPHGFKTDDDGCERCKCRQCHKLKDCAKKCVHGFQTNERACPVCKCRTAPEDGTTGTDATMLETLSCPSKDGNARRQGEQWHDGCRQCVCHGGHEMCAVIACPVPHCDQPDISAGSCCPTCPGGAAHPVHLNVTVCQSVDGRTYSEGQLWQLGPCTRCLCRAGRVLCNSPSCPPAACNSPVYNPGDCCATCADTSSVDDHQAASCRDSAGVERRSGQTWRRDACVSCVCRDGAVDCFHQSCPALDCARPVLKKGHCCPVCLEPTPASSCTLSNGTLMPEGLSWQQKECVACLCQGGQTHCSRKPCPEVCGERDPADPCCPDCKEPGGGKRNYHLLDGASKATHRTVVRPQQNPAEGPDDRMDRETGDSAPSNRYTVLCVVIGCLAVALVALLLGLWVRRQRRGYSPKHLTDEKRPLNDPQIMHFVRLDNRGVPHDTLVLEKNGDAAREA